MAEDVQDLMASFKDDDDENGDAGFDGDDFDDDIMQVKINVSIWGCVYCILHNLRLTKASFSSFSTDLIQKARF